jgi:hypothetical protein
MKEYPKGDVINFFKLVVKPALEDCAAGLKERGWKTVDLQSFNPEDPNQWFDNTFNIMLNASKYGELPASHVFRYLILAKFVPLSNSCHLIYEIARNGPHDLHGDYPRDINEVTKEDFLKDIKTQYSQTRFE